MGECFCAVGQAEAVEPVGCDCCRFCPGFSRQAERHVLERREVGEQGIVLENQSSPAALGGNGHAGTREHGLADPDMSSVERLKPSQDPEQG